MIIKDGEERNVIAPSFLGLQFLSPLTCVQLNVAVITVNFSCAKRRLGILRRFFMSEERIGRYSLTGIRC